DRRTGRLGGTAARPGAGRGGDRDRDAGARPGLRHRRVRRGGRRARGPGARDRHRPRCRRAGAD
ncbi:MAG: hypothetical protein AVDCRST_MAG66-3045, partial [uncultured Pseudonocardia sp.]